jgi:hypothetical protein
MKFRQINILVFLFGLSVLSNCVIDPCPNKEKMIESMDKLVLDASNKAPSGPGANWTSMDARFNKLVSDCYDLYKEELSINAKKDYWLNGIRYYKHRYGENWYEKLDDPNDILSIRLEKEIGETIESSAENVIDFIKEVYGDDIKEGIDEVVDELEKLGEELKIILTN